MTLTLDHSGLLASRSRRSVWRRVAAMLIAARGRRHLATLDDHLLRDIGLSRAEAEAETRRPVWDVPGHWYDARSGQC
ncbi:MAG: DUF1127 domain-containing protein [Pseudomonadota bacterium]